MLAIPMVRYSSTTLVEAFPWRRTPPRLPISLRLASMIKVNRVQFRLGRGPLILWIMVRMVLVALLEKVSETGTRFNKSRYKLIRPGSSLIQPWTTIRLIAEWPMGTHTARISLSPRPIEISPPERSKPQTSISRVLLPTKNSVSAMKHLSSAGWSCRRVGRAPLWGRR